MDGEELAVGKWEDLYGKLAQVRGHLCFQPYVSIRCLSILRRKGWKYDNAIPRFSL